MIPTMQRDDSGFSRGDGSTGGSAPLASHNGLLVSAAVLAALGGILAAIYGAKFGILSLKALALDFLLAAVGSLLAFSAQRLRKQWHEAVRIANTRQASEAKTSVASRWAESDLEADAEQSEDVLFFAVNHKRKLHYLFLGLAPTAILMAWIGGMLWSRGSWVVTEVSQQEAIARGVVCLALSCLWLVLLKSFQALRREACPEASSLAMTFRGAQWTTIVVAATALAGILWPTVDLWVGAALLVWILAVAGEQFVRLAMLWWKPDRGPEFLPPLHSTLRRIVLEQGNPVSSVFDAIEQSFGLSFRSSWAIRFVRAAALPTFLLALLMFWGMTSLSIVGPGEYGIRETLGRIQPNTLGPGLHWKLPWPLGRILRFPVKQIVAKPIGFVASSTRPTAYLWTKSHAEEEFSLVLGDGTEAVAVNAMVYYKIREDDRGFLDYVYRFQNPVDAMEGYAYRALMEQTRSATLKEVLSANRAQFAGRLKDKLRDYCDKNRLGIDVVDVALVSLHPPVEAAADYLDVIGARIDAERYQIEERGNVAAKIEDAAMQAASAIAEASVELARRVGKAVEESGLFLAIGKAYSLAPEAFQLRLRGDTLEEILGNKPLILIDKTFLGGAGETLLDLRPSVQAGDPVTSGAK